MRAPSPKDQQIHLQQAQDKRQHHTQSTAQRAWDPPGQGRPGISTHNCPVAQSSSSSCCSWLAPEWQPWQRPTALNPVFPAQIQTFPGCPELPAHLKTHRKSCQPPAPVTDPKCSPRAPEELSCWPLTPLAVDPLSVKHPGELVAVWAPAEPGRGKGREKARGWAGNSLCPLAGAGVGAARAEQAELSIKPFLLCGTRGQEGSTAPSEPPCPFGDGAEPQAGVGCWRPAPQREQETSPCVGREAEHEHTMPHRVCPGHNLEKRGLKNPKEPLPGSQLGALGPAKQIPSSGVRY